MAEAALGGLLFLVILGVVVASMRGAFSLRHVGRVYLDRRSTDLGRSVEDILGRLQSRGWSTSAVSARGDAHCSYGPLRLMISPRAGGGSTIVFVGAPCPSSQATELRRALDEAFDG